VEVGIVEADRRLCQDVSAGNGDFRRHFIGSTNFGGILRPRMCGRRRGNVREKEKKTTIYKADARI